MVPLEKKIQFEPDFAIMSILSAMQLFVGQTWIFAFKKSFSVYIFDKMVCKSKQTTRTHTYVHSTYNIECKLKYAVWETQLHTHNPSHSGSSEIGCRP